MSFPDTVESQLNAPLRQEHVSSRSQGGMKLSYIEGWHAIAEANRIFGFGNWSRETAEFSCAWSGMRSTKNGEKPACTYIAKVRVQVYTESSAFPTVREGCGAGHGMGTTEGEAHESALKEAETDAMKRALMTFGNQFGLALYDKSQKNVTNEKEAATGEGKTALQARMKEFATELEACDDNSAIDGLMEGYRAAVEQCKRDLPNWWFGKEGSDNLGLKARIDERRLQLEGAT